MNSVAYIPQRIIHMVAICGNYHKSWSLAKSSYDFYRNYKEITGICAFCKQEAVKYYEGFDINQ